MMLESFPDLITAYLEEHLKGKASYSRRVAMAAPWIRMLTVTPTRDEILKRHKFKGHDHFEKGSAQANEELALVRAACRWGIYNNRWNGGDPTLGVKKWRRPRRNHPAKHEEIIMFREHLMKAPRHEKDVRARTALMSSIRSYGTGGCWEKGKTKNGENQDLPLPSQLMPWIAAWKATKPSSVSPYLF